MLHSCNSQTLALCSWFHADTLGGEYLLQSIVMFLSFTEPKFGCCCFTQSKWKNIACTEDDIRHTLRWDVIQQFGETLINRLWHLKFDIYLTGRSSATGQNRAAKCPAVVLNKQVCIWNHKWITNKFRDFINSKVTLHGWGKHPSARIKIDKTGCSVCKLPHKSSQTISIPYTMGI